MSKKIAEAATSATEAAGWMTRARAAGYMDVSLNTIDRWAREGKIRRYQVAGMRSVRFKREELDALVSLSEA